MPLETTVPPLSTLPAALKALDLAWQAAPADQLAGYPQALADAVMDVCTRHERSPGLPAALHAVVSIWDSLTPDARGGVPHAFAFAVAGLRVFAPPLGVRSAELAAAIDAANPPLAPEALTDE